MKKLILGFAVLFSMSVSAQNLNTPAPSPGQTIKQDFALSSIEINYSRPGMKGRSIFGGLVPFDAMWRTGANGATTVEFGEDVTFGGESLKAGKYTILTIPGKSEWEIVVCEEGTAQPNYTAEKEVVRFSVASQQMPFDVESFTILFGDQTANSVDIELVWETTIVSIPVVADIHSQILGQIDNVMNNDNRPFYAAAAYYFEHDLELEKTLDWAIKAADAQPDAYWVKYLLAQVQAKSGNKDEAKAAANASMALAKDAGNMDYVRLNEDFIKSL